MRAKNDELNEKLKTCTEANVSLVEKIKQLEEQIASYVASNKMADVSRDFCLFFASNILGIPSNASIVRFRYP